jgi:ribose-phosphate pyrophosphokinase
VVLKRRLDPQRRELVAMSAQVSGQRVLIYDDMIRTGGSLLNAAQAYRNAGAQEIFALTTHGVFPGDALEKIRASGLLKKVVCTNSHPRALELRSEYLEVLSVARVFAERLRQKY